ncbi:MAG: CDP-alcohol phosphatidyltransferase family protein [Desulfuromonadaceae bacterium]
MNIRIPSPHENPFLPAAILRDIKNLAVSGWVVLTLAGLILGWGWGWSAALQWVLQAAVLWMLVLYETSRHLPLNCAPSGTSMYPRLGLANRLTIIRGWLIACTGGFLFQEQPPGAVAFVPGAFYTLSAIIDRLDGYAVRKSGQVSRMGAQLDTLFDALGLAIAPLLAFWYGRIHWTYLGVSCAYYVFQLGVRYRRAAGLPLFELRPKRSRRAIAGFQMGFIAVVLFPVFEPPATHVGGFVFMLPLLGGFILDWLSVSGRISESSRLNHFVLKRGENLMGVVVQPCVRVVLAATLMLWMFWSPLSFASPLPAHPFTLYGMLACGALLLFGILGRVSALLLVLLLGWHYTIYMPGVLDYILLSATLWLLVLGPGRFNLYSWDEEWVNRYDGAE